MRKYRFAFLMLATALIWPSGPIGRSGMPAARALVAGERIVFTDITKAAGISFIHDNAATPDKYLIETMGSGCGWIDYDNDGLLDLYVVNGAATKAYKPQHALRSALYHNNGDGTFTDVTAHAGVGAEGLFGMGVAVGDYDNDGLSDLYVIGYGRSILYHNNGDGTFTDVTARAGVADAGKWGSSAAWFDYNNDGNLDLVVANYVDWSPENNLWCGDHKPGYRGYCHPDAYNGQKPTLYRNNGDGTFSDVSGSSGVGTKPGNGLGVVTFDYDEDGWQDIFIANDSMANFLFHNNHNGTFSEVAYMAGVAASQDGRAEAGMGTDAGDTTNNGWLDVFVTHLDFENARLYHNLKDGSFDDATYPAKLGYVTFHSSGFGVRMIDYDNDGFRDIVIANGHILDNIRLYHADTQYAEPKQVFHNDHRGSFENVSDKLGPDLVLPRVSRGLAVGDFDNDGHLDLLVSNNGQSPQLLRNEGGNANHWLEVSLVGNRSNRDGVGARLHLLSGNLKLYDERKGGMSYQSAQDPRVHFGLGENNKVDLLEIHWPSGTVDKLRSIDSDQVVTVKEGAGLIARAFPRVGVH